MSQSAALRLADALQVDVDITGETLAQASDELRRQYMEIRHLRARLVESGENLTAMQNINTEQYERFLAKKHEMSMLLGDASVQIINLKAELAAMKEPA